MKTLKLLPFLLGTIMLFTYCSKDEIVIQSPVPDNPEIGLKDHHIPAGDDCLIVQKLWAGAGQNDTSKGTEVGYVTVEIDYPMLYVTYHTNGMWAMTEAHLWVGTEISAIPKNAAPGQFPYKMDLDYASEYMFPINLEDMGIGEDDMVYVAAHAVVKGQQYVNIDEMLPETAMVYVKYYNHDPKFYDSYFHVDLSEAGYLNGNFQGWCLDPVVSMNFEYNPYGAKVYNSYGYLPDGLVEYPDHLPAVNWLLNQDLDGYSVQDIQVAIWILLEGLGKDYFDANQDVLGIVDFDWEKAQKLVGYAMNHLDYKPECGKYIGIILVNKDQQTIIIKVPVPCKDNEGSETAWAYGEYTFKQQNVAKKWGWIFKVDLSKCEVELD